MARRSLVGEAGQRCGIETWQVLHPSPSIADHLYVVVGVSIAQSCLPFLCRVSSQPWSLVASWLCMVLLMYKKLKPFLNKPIFPPLSPNFNVEEQLPLARVQKNQTLTLGTSMSPNIEIRGAGVRWLQWLNVGVWNFSTSTVAEPSCINQNQ